MAEGDIEPWYEKTFDTLIAENGGITVGAAAAAAEAIRYVRALWEDANVGPEASICVTAYSARTRDAIQEALQATGIATVVISAETNHDQTPQVVRLATMHRVKGLEFDAMIVVAPEAAFGPPTDTQVQRKLLYVALTRAKRAAPLVRMG